MKISTKKLEENFSAYPFSSHSPDSILFFDIETTGFSADTTALYLIGVLSYQEHSWILEQWLSENGNEEKKIIEKFLERLKNIRLLICYNGTTFDLPYIKKKMEFHSLQFDFSKLTILDYYREFRPFKSLFGLENLKQPSVESFLGITRKNDYSGGELISVYSSYLKMDEKEADNASHSLFLLFEHNSNDILGLFKLSSLYLFTSFFQANVFTNIDYKITFLNEPVEKLSSFSVKNRLYCHASFLLPFVPKFSLQTSNLLLEGKKNELHLYLPIFVGELKYFYPDYKNYYYLPKEDSAVHKSLSSFLPKEHRIPAKANTCYRKKSGSFLPYFFKEIEENIALFKESYDSFPSYLQIEDFQNAEKKESILLSYLLFLIEKG